MSTDTAIQECIERAATSVGSVWPLHSFVTANPLAGFEDRPFHEAVDRAGELLGGDGYPSADVFRRALASGAIDREVLEAELAAHGYEADPETLLERMASGDDTTAGDATADGVVAPTDGGTDAADKVDRVLVKWLAAFLDQGQAEWPMPNREQGFYAAFRSVARHDDALPDPAAVADLPDDPVAAVESLLAPFPVDQWEAIVEHHLAALPGWTGFIRQRVDAGDDWQATHPITLVGYVAVRLFLTDQFDASIEPPENDSGTTGADSVTDDEQLPLPEVWLRAWEASYRSELVGAVTDASATMDETSADGGRPDAQLVFCIDTRSEVFRRHLESTGAYETHGFAGFFGVPMRYEAYDSDVSIDACPPILDAERRIVDAPAKEGERRDDHDLWTRAVDTGEGVIETLRANAATAFSFVESAGSGYGAALAARTLLPGRVHDLDDAVDERVPDAHEFCEPSIHYNPEAAGDLPLGLTPTEQVEYAASAFEQMGWTEFARVVAFVGHAAQSANNPFDSSLDCGACAGNPGGPNARVLAAICNDDRVQEGLRERGFDLPEDTVFVAGEHNTTTDEVDLYTGPVPESHAEDIEQLRADLATAREGAAAERAEAMGADGESVSEVERRAADWAETRPEWGLAGNAAFVVGPRDLTSGLDLDGRSFLHSYDWRTDPEGEALEAIMTGPMVVTQWINTQYYFATVDTGVYGSGSKVTHNPVGNVGVYQGNGGDLMTGLPLQSVMTADDEPYHQPLRLSTVVHAPVERVTDVLADHDDLAGLLDNGWLSLTVVDPEQDHRAFHYDGDLSWTAVEPELASPTRATPPTADD